MQRKKFRNYSYFAHLGRITSINCKTILILVSDFLKTYFYFFFEKFLYGFLLYFMFLNFYNYLLIFYDFNFKKIIQIFIINFLDFF